MNENEITKLIIGACIEVHRALGPGLLESIYEDAVCHELHRQNISWERQRNVPVYYKACRLSKPLVVDLLVESLVILELKAKDEIHSIDKTKLRTYLCLSNLRVGLLINFNVEYLKDGIVRIVNNFSDDEKDNSALSGVQCVDLKS